VIEFSNGDVGNVNVATPQAPAWRVKVRLMFPIIESMFAERKTMSRFNFLLGLFFLLVVSASAQLIQTPKGPVEFIGLSTWSPERLYDTLQAIAPKKPIAACAADLRFKLGFADASVVLDYDNGKLYTKITVVEPQFSSRVNYRRACLDTATLIKEWSPAFSQFDASPNDFFMALQFYPSRSVDTIFSLMKEIADSISVAEAWRTLEGYRNFSDKELAFKALREDGNHKNRIMSVAVLTNFLLIDSTWWQLVDALRDPDGRVSGLASSVLLKLAHVSKRQIDWAPATRSLRAILDGTNLFAFPQTLEILTDTHVAPNLAGPLLKGGGDLVLAYLSAYRGKDRELAHQFLVQLAGRDYGLDLEKWKFWINAL
jgi:hypothetical protein